jgi:hypothetical protein
MIGKGPQRNKKHPKAARSFPLPRTRIDVDPMTPVEANVRHTAKVPLQATIGKVLEQTQGKVEFLIHVGVLSGSSESLYTQHP